MRSNFSRPTSLPMRRSALCANRRRRSVRRPRPRRKSRRHSNCTGLERVVGLALSGRVGAESLADGAFRTAEVVGRDLRGPRPRAIAATAQGARRRHRDNAKADDPHPAMSAIVLHTHALPLKADARPRGGPGRPSRQPFLPETPGFTRRQMRRRSLSHDHLRHRPSHSTPASSGRPQIRLQRVIADAQHTRRLALVAAPPLEHQPGVAPGPRPQRLVPSQRGPECRQVIAADERRQILQLDDISRLPASRRAR